MSEDINKMKNYVLKKFSFQSDINIPLYKETKNSNGWINYGQDNLMPEYYLGLLGRSPKHNAIVQTKQQLIAGNGWQKEGIDALTINFLKNPFGEADLDEIAARVAYDFEIFGAFALEIIWNKDRETIKAINHIPVNKVRAKIKDDSGNDDGYYVCNNWRKWSSTPIVYVPKFSTINRKDANQILYAKKYTPGAETYGIPGYMSAARWCELEYEISNFHLNAAKNGFTPGMRINIPFGMPNEDEIDREINRLRSEFEGTNNANAPVITFSDGDENKITFESMEQNSSDERFIQLNKEITEGIMTGHQVTSPTLFGVMQEGMMVNKTATINDLQQFQAQYVTPKQNFLEKVFNRLGSINGANEVFLNKYELDYDVELSVSDLLAVIGSEIPLDQKKQVLISCGYRPEEANRLIESGGINDTTAPEITDTINPAGSSIERDPNTDITDVDVEAQAKARLKGSVGGVQGILQIQKSVSDGITDYNAALAILDLIYGISANDAKKILGTPATSLNKFKVTYGNARTANNAIKSSNVWKYKYDDVKQELVIKFNDGTTYIYDNLPIEIFEQFVLGDAVCKTSGSNKYGSWEEGKTPSMGAAVWDVLVDNGYPGRKGGIV